VQYGTVVASLVLLYRVFFLLPMAEKVWSNVPFMHDFQLAVLMWILLPSNVTGGTPTMFKWMVMLVNKNIKNVPTGGAVGQHKDRLTSFLNMALFFVNTGTRNMLLEIVSDGYVLVFLLTLFTPITFVTRIGCLGAGLAFPIYKSIIHVNTHDLAPSPELTTGAKMGNTTAQGGSSAEERDSSGVSTSVQSSFSSLFRRKEVIKEEKSVSNSTATKKDRPTAAKDSRTAVETNPSMGCPLLCQWLKYWVVYGLMALMEANVETVARYIPLFYHAQLLLLVYLQLPYFRGAAFLHDTFYKLILVSDDKKRLQKAGGGLSEPEELPAASAPAGVAPLQDSMAARGGRSVVKADKGKAGVQSESKEDSTPGGDGGTDTPSDSARAHSAPKNSEGLKAESSSSAKAAEEPGHDTKRGSGTAEVPPEKAAVQKKHE